MQFTQLLIILAVALVAPGIEGFAPSRLPKISVHVVPTTIKSQNSCNRNGVLNSAAASSMEIPVMETQGRSLNRMQSKIVKVLMTSYIASMCVALPVAKLIGRITKEKWSLHLAQFCSRWLMRVFPFASKRVLVDADDEQLKNPEPSIWVCNHISMLDLFFVLALDNKMRGKNRRPIKILYWKGLEANPVTGLLCKMCGFIPVDMTANGNGNANEYDPKSFKQMLRSTKAAIKDGFDIGILPEGQPNPTPEKGLQPIFSGAFTLARMSRRPIKMMSLYGLHRMWHPDDNIGMECAARDMAVRVYPGGRVFKEAEEFTSTFEAVAGHWGAHGKDLPDEELKMWLDGSMWQTELSRRASTRMAAEDIEREANKQESNTEKPSDAAVRKN
ncbi:hypothetical protein ACHAXR_010632 [Thalassiosira sp. AJA248-18]